jgi:hypothetical protein
VKRRFYPTSKPTYKDVEEMVYDLERGKSVHPDDLLHVLRHYAVHLEFLAPRY